MVGASPGVNRCVLVVNGGSSSLKFAVYTVADPPNCVVSGKFDRVGRSDGSLTVTQTGRAAQHRSLELADHAACIDVLADVLDSDELPAPIAAIGHRVVHGGNTYSAPEHITAEVLAELRRLSPFAPAHVPHQIALIEALQAHYPGLEQIACFDTAFHRDNPRVAKLLPIPRRYEAAGVRRYGFHGLSYSFLMQELQRIAGDEAADGRIILAHLGNGASMAAVRARRPLDSTMGFTPAAGLMMSTRSGDLDPGVVEYLARTEGLDARGFYEMVHARSGLLGVSETSSDVRDLLEREATDPRAADALALFCYQAKKWLGALTAVLGGLDTLVFAGGIGENAPAIRARLCDGLDFLGLHIDADRNQNNEPVISVNGSGVTVRVLPTNEELFMAQVVAAKLRQAD